MITPNKLLDLNYCLLTIAAKIIKYLTVHQTVKYDELFKQVKQSSEADRADYIFLPALDFLFLLGRIKYHKNIDSIELILNQELTTSNEAQ